MAESCELHFLSVYFFQNVFLGHFPLLSLCRAQVHLTKEHSPSANVWLEYAADSNGSYRPVKLQLLRGTFQQAERTPSPSHLLNVVCC